MRAVSEAELLSIGRVSRRAGWVTGIGALLLLGAIGYSAWELGNLRAAVSSRRAELAKAEALARSFRDEAESLNEQIVALRKQKGELESSLVEINTVVAEKKVTGLTESIRKLTPLSAVAKPQASAVLIPGSRTGDGRQMYEFSLWLDLPPGRGSQIRSVAYEFNHPTFRMKRQTSTDLSSGFRVAYRGWGCLQRIIITLTLTDGSTQPVDFDMCSALGW